jgi:hypothetical protein
MRKKCGFYCKLYLKLKIFIRKNSVENYTLFFFICIMIYLTAIGLTSGGSSTVHIYTQTIHRTTQSTQNNAENNTIHQLGRVRAVSRLCVLYPGICLTTEEKAWKNLSQGREQNMHNYKST